MGVNNLDYVRTAKENCFVLAGKSSLDFGIVVTNGEDFFKSAERDTDSYEVPGRNGDLIVDNGRFKNLKITVECLIETDFVQQFEDFKNFAGKLRGYVRLENTFVPDVYQLASIKGLKIKSLGTRYHSGTFEIEFECKPQKYLKSGESRTTFIPANINEQSAGSLLTSYVTRYFPVNTDNYELEITVRCPDGENIELSASSLDANKEYISGSTQHATNGQTVTLSIDAGASYYDIEIAPETLTSLDGVSAHVKGGTRYDGVNFNYEGNISKTLDIMNPTGFGAKPLFEFYSFTFAAITITNYLDGVAEEFFTTQANSYTAANHVFIDCDMQYVYDSSGANCSQYLSIITAQNRNGKSLVFPRLGGEDSVISVDYRTTPVEYESTTNYVPCLFYITPRWWRL